jgi:hypothetical protein
LTKARPPARVHADEVHPTVPKCVLGGAISGAVRLNSAQAVFHRQTRVSRMRVRAAHAANLKPRNLGPRTAHLARMSTTKWYTALQNNNTQITTHTNGERRNACQTTASGTLRFSPLEGDCSPPSVGGDSVKSPAARSRRATLSATPWCSPSAHVHFSPGSLQPVSTAILNHLGDLSHIFAVVQPGELTLICLSLGCRDRNRLRVVRAPSRTTCFTRPRGHGP